MFDGQAVMEHFKVDRPVLVLLDVMLSGNDGLAILKELRSIKMPYYYAFGIR